MVDDMGDEKEQIRQEGDGADSYPGTARAAEGTEDAEMNITENECLKEFFIHMERIKGVRVPGEGKPKTLDAAIEVAQEQGRANRSWAESGRPLGEIKVWAEGREVMCVLPHLPAQLRRFTFDMPSPEAAMLQLTTQTDGELIVLSNLRLSDVPDAGLRHTETWPSGEELSLWVCREGRDKFQVEVALNPQQSSRVMKAYAGASYEGSAEASAEGGFDRKDEERDSGLSKRTRALPAAGWWANLKASLGSNPLSVAYASMAVATVFFTSVLLWNSQSMPVSYARGREGRRKPTSEVRRTEPDAFTSAAPAELEDPPIGRDEDSGPIIMVPASAPRPAKRAMRKNYWHQRRTQPQTPVADGRGGGVVKTGQKSPVPLDLGANGMAEDGVSAWDVRRAAKLAAVQRVYIQFGSAEAGEPPPPETLRASFVRALEHSKLFRVVADSEPPATDAVITLRFEPDDARLGAIFMDVRDVKGNFLWQDFTGCRRAEGEESEPTMCADASERLVDNFRGVVARAQKTTMQLEALAAGR
jgi:hypothetical protein